jgi:hypothetical protein
MRVEVVAQSIAPMPYLEYALLAIVAWGLAALGAVEPSAYWPLALAAALVGGLAFLRACGRTRGAAAWALPAALGLLIGATALQLVPVPRPLILRFTPATDAFLQRAGSYHGPLWSDPSPTHPLSVSPDATLVGLLLLCAFAALFLGAARALSARQTRTLALALPLLGALAAAMTIVQSLASGQTDAVRDRLIVWLLLTMPIGVGYACGLAGRGRAKTAVFGSTILMAITLVWMTFDKLSGAAGAASVAWDHTWSLIRDFRPAGTGLNTYGTATMLLQPLNPTTGYNEYLRFAAEGGLLLVVPAVLVVLLFTWEAIRRLRDRSEDRTMRWIRLGAVAGLSLLALYELGGLSLEVPGNAALLAIVGGMVLQEGGRRDVGEGREGRH